MKNDSKSKIRRRLFSINHEIMDIDFNLSKISGINYPLEIDILCLFYPSKVPSDWSPVSCFVDSDIMTEAMKIQRARLIAQQDECFKLLGKIPPRHEAEQ